MSSTASISAPSAVLSELRSWLRDQGFDAWYQPSSDLYLNEYVLPRGRRLTHLSGFGGSAGEALITQDRAWIFVDGRYHIEAEQVLQGSEWTVRKLGLKVGTAEVDDLATTAQKLAPLRIACDPASISESARRSLLERWKDAPLHLLLPEAQAVSELWQRLWPDAPPPRDSGLSSLAPEDLGESIPERIARFKESLVDRGAQATVVTKLDQIAWLFGLRGDDIPYNPLFEARLVVLADRLIIYSAAARHQDFLARLPEGTIAARRLEDFSKDWPGLVESARYWLLDPERQTAEVFSLYAQARPDPARELIEALDPIEDLKSVKTPAELQAMRRAGRLAACAELRTERWLESRLEAGQKLSEADYAAQLAQNYQALPGSRGLSFASIVAAGSNSAIVHYSHPSSERILAPGDWFLVDSGVQLRGGTTDATRTWVIGAPDAEQRRIYTLVLKAHIAQASLRFPQGTCGLQLDAITRAPLWRAGEDYIHGTGHGVGAGLNVHEGPMLVAGVGRGQSTSRPLRAGQIISIEPGIYRAGYGGVRLENLYEVRSAGDDKLGRATLAFHSMTWRPFTASLLDHSILESWERDWLRAAHSHLVAELSSSDLAPVQLSSEEAAWLQARCQPFLDL